jgi:hypothetical protein
LQDVKELAETIRMHQELTMDGSEDTHYNDDFDDEQQSVSQIVQTTKTKRQQQITIQR